MSDLPTLYFRGRENGAAVFRLDGENRDRRLELEQIAVVNTNRGDFKALGDHILTCLLYTSDAADDPTLV